MTDADGDLDGSDAAAGEGARPATPTRLPDPLVVGGVLAAVAVALAVGWLQALRPGFGPDFFTFWQAARNAFGDVYRFDPAPGRPLPFVYPPPLLLFLAPLGVLGRTSAYLLWLGLSVGAFVAAATVVAKRLAPLVLLAPPVVFAGVTGQTSLLIGAALLYGLSQLSRSWLAGLLFGAALSVKPQLLFLLPAGLVAAGYWRVLAATLLAGAILCGLSALVFGLHAWRDWLEVLPLHQAWEARAHLRSVSLAPQAGLPLRLALAAAGCALAAVAFRRDDLCVRLVAVAGGSMLAAPHAMGYDAAVMVPCALVALRRPTILSLPAAALYLGWITTPWTLAAYTVACGSPLAAALCRAALRGGWSFLKPSAKRQSAP